MVEAPPATVVVIDDDVAVLELFQFMLEAAGFPVTTYLSAPAYLRGDLVRPRCLILDQHMPQMTGLELAEELRAKGVEVPILMVTSALSPELTARAAACGIGRVLGKPPPESELIGFVQACG